MTERVVAPLPFEVYLKTRDGLWTRKAAFATEGLAGAYVIGLRTQRLDPKILEAHPGGLRSEVTDRAVGNARKAFKDAR